MKYPIIIRRNKYNFFFTHYSCINLISNNSFIKHWKNYINCSSKSLKLKKIIYDLNLTIPVFTDQGHIKVVFIGLFMNINSFLKEWWNPQIACFEDIYSLVLIPGVSETREARLTIWPYLFFSISGSSSLISWTPPRKLTLITYSNSSIVISWKNLALTMPALLIKMSIFLCWDSTVYDYLLISSKLLISH